MRLGFTTGSCSAAAAKAATYMLLSGRKKKNIVIETPKGIPFEATLLDIKRTENLVCCAVEKDGGDDPDVTTGALVYAEVSYWEDAAFQKVNANLERGRFFIDGGVGVGRVTRPGLDQPVGNAAINHVPREMIAKEVDEVCNLFDYCGKLKIIISVPDGEEIAEKTFNSRLGIVGGISILGTSGVVEPMSSQALVDTIRVELNQRRAEGNELVAVSPGNYGLDYMLNTYGYDLDKSVKCSNFIGKTIDIAVELGFKRMLLTGHVGKLVKVSGGIMNTHSKEADCRMELMLAALLQAASGCGALLDRWLLEVIDETAPGACSLSDRVLSCYTTEEAIGYIKELEKRSGLNILKPTMEKMMERIIFYLNKRAQGRLQIECIMYSKDYGELAKSDGARAFLEELLEG